MKGKRLSPLFFLPSFPFPSFSLVQGLLPSGLALNSHVAEKDIEFVILLSSFPHCWDYRCVPPPLVCVVLRLRTQSSMQIVPLTSCQIPRWLSILSISLPFSIHIMCILLSSLSPPPLRSLPPLIITCTFMTNKYAPNMHITLDLGSTFEREQAMFVF